MSRGARAWVLVVALAAAATAAPPLGAAPEQEDAKVVSYVVTLVDATRPTAATAVSPGSDERVLETTIAYPKNVDERMPLIVLAHGNSGHPEKFKILIDAWASAGYVVVAPTFPLTNRDTPGGSQPGDVTNQPADVSFVIDEVLKLARKRADSPIAGLVDKRHIGVAGLSLGGATVYGLVFNTCCIDERVDAVVAMSALRLDFDGEYDWRSLPTLLVHGDADGIYRVSTEVYPLLAPPKWFVTLHGSTHSAPFEDSTDPADEAVPGITTAFFDRYLKGEKRAAKRLVDAVEEYGNADLERDVS